MHFEPFVSSIPSYPVLTYKIPRDNTPQTAAFARHFIWSLNSMGIGRREKTISVNIPIPIRCQHGTLALFRQFSYQC